MTSPRREVYRHWQMRRLIAPESVAIIGASQNPAAYGSATFRNMARYTGRVHFVNARYDRIGDLPCWPSIAALPETPDCVIVAVPREAVEGLVAECAARGVGGVVIFSAGFAESGRPELIDLQARIVAIAREADMRLVGPNCMGISNFPLGFSAVFIHEAGGRDAGTPAVGLASQSGAMGNALSQALHRGVPLSHVLTAGNSCDVDVADYVSYLAEDPSCQAIGCVFEGLADPERMLQAAEIARVADKPVVVHKLARGGQATKMAMSHTGSLAGSDAAYRALFDRAGMVVAESYEALVESAAFFAKAPRPVARGVAVVTTSGGFSIMAADEAEARDIPLPPPGPETMAVLEKRVPEFGSRGNPCDVTGQVLADPQSITDCTGAFLRDPAYGALVVPQMYAAGYMASRIETFAKIAESAPDKPFCVVWTTEWLEGSGAKEIEAHPRMSMFRSMGRCFDALGAWQARAARRAEGARDYRRLAAADAAAQGAQMIGAAANKALTERESKAVLDAYGVPVVGETLAKSLDEALAAAARFGYPVALKVESPDIAHKTEAGVIRLNVVDDAALREAHAAVLANAARHAPAARINGVLVQPMVPAGVEIMVGARVDPLFGPLVVVGLGGILVELMKDTAIELAPVTAAEARRMLGRLKGRRLLEGFRGLPAVDFDALAAVIVRLSELAADQRDRVAELDVNPLICAGARILAVDALIVKR